MATITDNDLDLFRSRAKTEIKSTGDVSRLAWDDVVDALCKEVARLRSVSRERGNVAKLREACEALMSEIGGYSADGLEVIWCRISGETIKKARAALAAPPRNCDRFKNADEAIEAVDTHCEYAANGCIGCPAAGCYSYDTDCRIAWLFAPATEKEGGDDAD